MKLKSNSILDSWLTHVATDVHPSCQCSRWIPFFNNLAGWLEYFERCRSIGYSPQRLWPQTNNHQQYFCYFGLKKGTWISQCQVCNGEYVSRGWPSPAADGQCSQLIVLMNRQNCPAWLLYIFENPRILTKSFPLEAIHRVEYFFQMFIENGNHKPYALAVFPTRLLRWYICLLLCQSDEN